MDNFISNLFDILKINTIYNTDMLPFGSGNIKCLNYMLELGKKEGFKVSNLDNYCGYIEYGNSSDYVGVLCHLDIVDVNMDKWTSNPFDPVVIDNKIYARGALDDKGPLMASFYAIKELKDEGFYPNKKIRLIMGCNEESGSKCMEYYKQKEPSPIYSFSPDAEYPVIFGEKGILTIKVKGMIPSVIKEIKGGTKFNIVPDKVVVTLNDNTKLEYLGKSCHAMEPSKGINAISIAFNDLKTRYNDFFINFMDKYFTNDLDGHKLNSSYTDEMMQDLTENVSIISYENEYLELIINFRLPSNSCYDVIKKNLDLILKPYNLSYEILDDMKVHMVDPNSFLVKTLLNSYIKYTNDFNAKAISIGGGTYAKSFKNSVAFGIRMPGEEDTCHIDNEYVNIDTLRKSILIMKDALKELCK